MSVARKNMEPSRAERKAKKRKLEEAIPDLPGEDNIANLRNDSTSFPSKRSKHNEFVLSSFLDIANSDRVETKEPKKRLKKSRRVDLEDRGRLAKEPVDTRALESKSLNVFKEISDKAMVVTVRPRFDNVSPGEALLERKSKKLRKAERKLLDAANAGKGEVDIPTPVEVVAVKGGGEIYAQKPKMNNRNREKKQKAVHDKEGQMKESKSPRFIVFVGNLPFSATTRRIEAHFAAVRPKSIRHLTKKDSPTESRGCAFVEFDGYDHMKACLKSFHHSTFDDGISPPRKINVELTAGGGGSKSNRQARIGEKNQKLNEERTRRIRGEGQSKMIRKDLAIDRSDVHPSRRAWVP